jgi:hypothetical protein
MGCFFEFQGSETKGLPSLINVLNFFANPMEEQYYKLLWGLQRCVEMCTCKLG